jgi:serine/threonine protein kinase
MIEKFGQDLMLAEKLAAGGMAEVYRAIQFGHGGFEKIIALKRILPHYAADDEFKHMFQMEANLSGLLQHPNVVQIFTNGESDGYLFLLMEFVDGKNVRQLLARADKKRIKIPIQFSCYMVSEACKGLEYAHNFADPKTGEGLNIVHRDMSPQNLMLSYDGAVKIVDFGIAKAAARSENTRAGILKGKFGYMSPEQAQGMPLDKRTDVFAMGIILFELLTQRRLFSHDDDMRTLQLVRDCNVPRPSKYNPDVGPTLDRIVLKALTKNKADRYESAGELYADLIRFMNSRYPEFIPTDFSKFLRKIFETDIQEEKKKREKIASEMPARLGANTSTQNAKNDKGVKIRDEDATNLEELDDGTGLTSNDIEGLEAVGGGALTLKGKSAVVKNPLMPSTEESSLPLPGKNSQVSGPKEAGTTPNPISAGHLSLSLPSGSIVKKASGTNASNPSGGNAAPPQASSLMFKGHNSLQLSKNSTTLPAPAEDSKPTRPAPGARPGDPKKPAVSVTLTPQPSNPSYRASPTGSSPGNSAAGYRAQPSIGGTPAARALRKESSSFAGSFLMITLVVILGGGGFYLFKDVLGGKGNSNPESVTCQAGYKKNNSGLCVAQAAASETPRCEAGQVLEDGQCINRSPSSAMYTPPENSGQLSFNSLLPLTVREIRIDGKILADKGGNKVQGPVKKVFVGSGNHLIEIVGSPFDKRWKGRVDVRSGVITPVDVELE